MNSNVIAFSTTTPASLGSVQGTSLPVITSDDLIQIQPALAVDHLYLPLVNAQE